MRRGYPSPQSSQLSSLGSTPSPDDMDISSSSLRDSDDTPPAKRRKLCEPRVRTTEKLDLSSGQADEAQKAQLDKLLKVLYKKRKIVVVAGAGISVSAGSTFPPIPPTSPILTRAVPDFRSSTGLFKTLKGQHNLKSSGKDLFDASVYKDDNSTTSFHQMVRDLSTATRSASPTPFHHLLATLAKEGRLLRLYTQNVDGIDTSLEPLATQVPLGRKGPWPKTVQLHGCLQKMVCTKCHQVTDLDPQLFDGPVPPPCRYCVENDDVRTQHAGKRSHGVGRLRPRMVLYNEHNPDDEAIGSVSKADLRTRPDALIVVGTTLKVPGVKRIVKEMCGVVRNRRDGVTVWINNDSPPVGKDFEWDLVVQGQCDTVASQARMTKWDEAYEEVSDEWLQKVKQETGTVQVVVSSPSKNKSMDRIHGVLTPLPSPRLGPRQADGKLISKITLKLKQPVAAAKKSVKVVKPVSGKGKRATGPKKKKNAPPTKQAPGSIMHNFKASKPAAQSSMDTPVSKGRLQWKSMKDEVSQPMQPVSPAAVCNNSNPPFQTPPRPPRSPITPRRSYTDSKGVSLSVEIPTGRVGESPEDRKRIVTPPGPLPENLRMLLN